MPAQESKIITGIIVSVILLFITGFFITILVAFINQRKKKFIEEKLLMESNFQQELLRAQLEIQEQTLRNISQEIHDNIGQVLTLAKLQLSIGPEIGLTGIMQKVTDTRSLIAKALQDLRDLSKSTNTDYVIEMGIARCIEYELEIINRAGFCRTQFDIIGSPQRFDRQKELILFRIVQEILTNAIKHSQASVIAVCLNYSADAVALTVSDDGVGFDLEEISKVIKPGLGIKNIQTRAKMIAASLEISSLPQKGTRFDFAVQV